MEKLKSDVVRTIVAKTAVGCPLIAILKVILSNKLFKRELNSEACKLYYSGLFQLRNFSVDPKTWLEGFKTKVQEEEISSLL